MKTVSSKCVFLLATSALLFACGGGGGGAQKPDQQDGGSPPTPTPMVTAEPMPTPTPTVMPTPTPTMEPMVTPTPVPGATRLSNTTCLPPPATVEPSAVSTEAAFPNLPAITFPLGMVQAPTSAGGFWFVIDRDGRVYSFDNSSTTSDLNISLDIRSRVTTEGEFGLTGLALHPNYPGDNRIFLLYNSSANGGRSTLSSFEVDIANRSISASSESILLSLDQLTPFHNGGDLAFGPDGLLYASFGDTDAGIGDFAEDTTNLHGSIIRIDINGAAPYGIPGDNPFNGQSRCNSSASSSGQNCPEIFAYGFRNPWRFSIDIATGDVWVGDVGDSAWEEVSRVNLGGNYGWPTMEGNQCGPSRPGCDRAGLALPIADYPSSGSSVVGGYVYRGSRSPGLVGQYIFGDFYSRQFYAVPADAAPNTNETSLFNANPGGAAMAQGNDGEIYILAMSGDEAGRNIFRITGGGGISVEMPERLSDTGCYDTVSKSAASGVFDYSLIAPLWSDGAAKRRSFAIPDGTQIGVLADGDFDFPTDSILIKHFLNGDTFLETRLMVNHANGWLGYSYEWNNEQTDAQLLSEGKRVDVGPFTHIYPTQAQCQACHTEVANNSLGLELAQLNKTDTELGANFIDYLTSAGYLASDHFGATSPTLYALDDDSASLEQRARSYLHSNCSSCHRPNGPFASIDLRYSTAFEATNTCGVDPSAGNLGVSNAKVIAPGNPDASVLVLRMEASEDSGNRMPRLGSLDVDEEAVSLIRAWISGIATCP